jgi:hypothetical protein
MRRKSAIAATVAVVLAMPGLAGASTAAQPKPPAVHVQQPLGVAHDVVISFRPRSGLRRSGYYYAVLVLFNYRVYTAPAPRCAISSDMAQTRYGYPHGGRAVRLVLAAAASTAGQWCAGGDYAGALYAVPHKPRYGTTAQCFGDHLCGIVAMPPPYTYPGGVPKPLDKSARLIRRFHVQFAAT